MQRATVFSGFEIFDPGRHLDAERVRNRFEYLRASYGEHSVVDFVGEGGERESER